MGDGGPGPYPLSRFFVDSASVNITSPDSTIVPPWTFVGERSGVLFAMPIDSGVAYRVRYATDYYGLPRMFSLYSRRTLTAREVDSLLGDSLFRPAPVSPEEDLAISGYKTVGVAVGSFGQVNLEQGLDVRIGGQVRPGTVLDAHLSDEGSSLDGATREISEFDMMYVTLKNPSYHVNAGDQYVEWPLEGILDAQKKIKGISGSFTPVKPARVGGFVALAGGNLAVENLKGRNGVQGPYFLSGRGEQDMITPIGGTVVVSVNGRKLEEGEKKNYVVDYDLGSVTFTPTTMITTDDLIRIEYEYKVFDYQRTLLGTSAALRFPDSLLRADGVVWSESDNRGNPIDLTLTDSDRAMLRDAGDSPPFSSTARPVHPNDVPEQDAFYPLYRRGTDSLGNSYFYHQRFNPLLPQAREGFYRIWFVHVGAGKGEYTVADSAFHREPVYRYVRPGNGDYTSLAPIPAPRRSTSGELKVDLNLPRLRMTTDVVGQETDGNLFSAIGDDDNLASATATSVLVGTRSTSDRCVWVAADHRYVSSRFDGEVLSAHQRRTGWDDTAITPVHGVQQQWESLLGGTMVPGVWSEIGYGQRFKGDSLATDKLSGAAGVRYWEPLTLEYRGTLFRHHLAPEQGRGHRDEARAEALMGDYRAAVFCRDEWRTDSAAYGAGQLGGGAELGYAPANIREAVTYSQMRRGSNGVLRAIDTGYTVRWEQSVEHPFLRSWSLSASSNYQYARTYNLDRTSSLLLAIASDIHPDNAGFFSRQEYTSSSELASRYVQIPRFAGVGMGTHAYDSTRGEFVPRQGGDFFLDQQEVSESGLAARVRKTALDISWGYKPGRRIEGILGDLVWEGTATLNEHLDASINVPASWFPGYYSLKPLFGKDDPGERVTFADLSYLQQVDWRPPSDSLNQVEGRLFVRPSYRKLDEYREKQVETGLEVWRHLGLKWIMGAGVGGMRLGHEQDGGAGNYTANDLHGELTQKYRAPWNLFFGISEVVGVARKLEAGRSDGLFDYSAPDSSMYYRVRPALEWRPLDIGWAEASYTLSVVKIPGDLDYRMAAGFSPGLTHSFSVSADVRTGKHFSVGGTYRGEIRRPLGSSGYLDGNHVVSVEMKAFM